MVLGVAAGIFLGDMMHRSARRPVAFALSVLGVAAIAPVVVDTVRALARFISLVVVYLGFWVVIWVCGIIGVCIRVIRVV